MEKFKYNWILLVIAIVLVSFSSCENDDDNYELEAIADVYVVGKKVGDVVKYAPEYVVSSNKKIKSVSVKIPGTNGESIVLDKNTSSVFIKKATDSDFIEAMPVTGDYVFTIISEDDSDEELTLKDVLEDKDLEAVSIKTAEYLNDRENISWDLVSNAGAYQIRLLKDDDVIFCGPCLKGTIKEYTFGSATNGWVDSSKKAEKGIEYQIELHAIKFETGKSEDLNNIQFVRVDNKSIKWGE